jgi:dihydroxyacetone kinase-like predicted kinase
VDENVNEMMEAYKNVKTGSVTYAIKDTSMDGVTINANDFMGILDKTIVASVPSKNEAAKALLDKSVTEDDGLITVLVGEDVSETEQDELLAYIAEKFDYCEVEVHRGNQPVYAYIFGIE